MRRLTLLLLLAACSEATPDTTASPEQAQVEAKAVADVEAATAAARRSSRRAGAGDAATIAALHTASWRTAYVGILDDDYLAGPIEADRLGVWAERLATPRDDLFVLLAETADGTARDFVCVMPDADPPWGALVDNLHTHPAHRGGGIGETLLRAAAAAVTGALHLWVYDANIGARRFYGRLGGKEVETKLSDMPASLGKPLHRVHWPDASARAMPPRA
jgi:GNAT superfamily N-acetyltransferase